MENVVTAQSLTAQQGLPMRRQLASTLPLPMLGSGACTVCRSDGKFCGSFSGVYNTAFSKCACTHSYRVHENVRR
jgi:hypothetical protein